MPLRSLSSLGAALLQTRAKSSHTRHPSTGADPSSLGPIDCSFYRKIYLDLRHLSDAKLRDHYRQHGRHEGRYRNQDEQERALWLSLDELLARAGPLPDTFDWRDYLALHSDLRHLGSDVEARLHFAEYGRLEGRIWRLFDHELYRSLYFKGSLHSREWLLDHFDREGQDRGWISKGRDLLKLAGLPDSTWLDRVVLDEFALLNTSWAGPIASRRDVLAAFQADDFARIAPLSFDLAFDPDFYRETHPGSASDSDEKLYRSWLFEGLDAGQAGTGRERLHKLGMTQSSYPDGFNWTVYRSRHCRGTDSRWDTLEHALKIGMPTGKAIPVKGPKAADFLFDVARYSERRASHRTADTCKTVLKAANPPQEALILLADAYLYAGQWNEASRAYAAVLQRGNQTIESCVNAVNAALHLDDVDQALNILARSRPFVGGDVRYRNALRTTIDKAFLEAWTAADRLYRADRNGEADKVMFDVVRCIADAWARLDPLGIKLPAPDPRRVVLLANTDLRQCTFYRVEQKADVFKAAGYAIEIYEQHEVEAFITALAGAGAAIFYRLPAMPMNIRAIQIANAMGIATLYDIDDLIFDPLSYPEPIETYGHDVTREFYTMLQLGVPLFRSAMALCTHGIASTTSLAARMKDIVRSGEVFVLPNGLDHRTETLLSDPVRRVRHDEGPVIFYGSGTKAHNSDFMDLAGEALIEILDRYPKARLFIAGYLSLDDRFAAFSSQIVMFGRLDDVNAYWSLLAEADINIAVLASYPTTDAKSEIKWLEAALLGVPSVVSGTHRYAEVLADGDDALIARSPNEWRIALHRLIEEPEERRRLVANAREKSVRTIRSKPTPSWFGA